MTKVSPTVLLNEFEDLLRTMPEGNNNGYASQAYVAWLGRAAALINIWDSFKSPHFTNYISQLHHPATVVTAMSSILTLVHQARNELRLQEVGPLSVSVNKGEPYNYFDEIRKVIEMAKEDIFFIDPYLDAEFISRYMPHVSKGVSIRLMGRERIASLQSAVEQIKLQESLDIKVRSAGSFHDRYIFIDKRNAYHSSASFKDGGKNTPSNLIQILDSFDTFLSIYENIWSTAKVIL